MAALMIVIYSAAMFAAGYFFHRHSGDASAQDRQAIRLSMLSKL